MGSEMCIRDREDTVIMREVVRTLRDEPRLSTALLPTGTGMLLAVRR